MYPAIIMVMAVMDMAVFSMAIRGMETMAIILIIGGDTIGHTAGKYFKVERFCLQRKFRTNNLFHCLCSTQAERRLVQNYRIKVFIDLSNC